MLSERMGVSCRTPLSLYARGLSPKDFRRHMANNHSPAHKSKVSPANQNFGNGQLSIFLLRPLVLYDY